MIGPSWKNWRSRLLSAGFATLSAAVALAAIASPAQARFFFAVGVPCCGYYGPAPYYGYGYYPPPAYYAPPPGYYEPQQGYYAPPAATPYTAVPSAGAPAPSAYAPPYPQAPAAPPPAPAAMSPSAMTAPTGATIPAITYTSKPAFTNPAGQTCREYKTSDNGRDAFGTACKQADGQWRVVN